MEYFNQFKNRTYFHVFLLLFCTINISAIEFVYPVAQLSDGTSMVMHQHQKCGIMLAGYNLQDSILYRSFLSSQFCPTKVCLLPDKTGFSFFDNGMVRVQNFLKRYPKTIEILYPLSHLQDIEWESPDIFYLSACYKKRNALFRVDTHANIDFVIFSLESDFSCPQKRGSELFFIDQSNVKSKTKYHFSGVNFDGSFGAGNKKLKNKKEDNDLKKNSFQVEYQDGCFSESNNLIQYYDLDRVKILIDFQDQPIIFLAMDSDAEGAAIGYAAKTEKTGEVFLFFYYFLYKDKDGDWQKKLLFSFSLPTNLFLDNYKMKKNSKIQNDGVQENNDRLIESIFPLLPKKIGNTIYYSSLVGQNVNLFSFLSETGVSRQLTFARRPDEHYFCPMVIEGNLYSGQTIIDKDQKVCLYRVTR